MSAVSLRGEEGPPLLPSLLDRAAEMRSCEQFITQFFCREAAESREAGYLLRPECLVVSMNNCLCRRVLESELSVAVDGRNGESRVCFPEEPNCQPLGVLRELDLSSNSVGGNSGVKGKA